MTQLLYGRTLLAQLLQQPRASLCIAPRSTWLLGQLWLNFNRSSHSQKSSKSAEVGRLNHVAIAVPDLDSAAQRYRNVLGAKVSSPQPVPEHGVTVVFVELPNTKIELLHPLGDHSPIKKFLERNPSGGIHHICLEVADVNTSLEALTPAGVRVLDPQPKIGAHGNPVVFLHPKDNDGVLMELEQTGSGKH